MNDEQIKTFLQVTKDRSFSKAEQQRYISKQSMFKQIKKLEEELSCTLFIRTSKGVTLSESGKTFYNGILKIQQELTDLKEKCRDDSFLHSIRIGSVEHQVILNPVTELFRKAYPNIGIKQIVHPNHSGEYRIQHGIMDVGETFRIEGFPLPGEFEYTKLLIASYYVAMKKTHPLAKNDTLSLKQLVSYPTQVYPMMIGPNYTKVIETVFKDYKDQLIKRVDVDNQVAVAYELLSNTSCILGANPFITKIDGLKVIPLKEKWKREYGIIYQQNPNALVKKYIALAKKYYRAK